MTGWLPVASVLGGLLSGVIGAYVALRKLPSEAGLTAAQRDQTMVGIAQGVAAMTHESLRGCREECAQLARRCRRLESALAAASIPIPTEEASNDARP